MTESADLRTIEKFYLRAAECLAVQVPVVIFKA